MALISYLWFGNLNVRNWRKAPPGLQRALCLALTITAIGALSLIRMSIVDVFARQLGTTINMATVYSGLGLETAEQQQKRVGGRGAGTRGLPVEPRPGAAAGEL